MNINDEALLEDELRKATLEFQANETNAPEPSNNHSKGDRNKIKKLAREKYEAIKKEPTFDPILKSKLAGLSGAYRLKLYTELVDLGILPPLENSAANIEQENTKLKEQEATRLLAAQQAEPPKNKRPVLTLKRKPQS